MKSTGIVRSLDNLGRLVIPVELRHSLCIENEPVEIFVQDNDIILRRYQPACIFCGESDSISIFKGKNVCSNCIKDILLLNQE